MQNVQVRNTVKSQEHWALKVLTTCLLKNTEKLLLMLVENACDTEVKETNGVFRSSKRKGNGVGIQSVRHIAEKNGGASTFTYRDNVFSAKIMLRGRAA